MSAISFSVLFVSLCTFLAIAGLLLVRRLIPIGALSSHHDVAAALLSVVGTLYAVLLGLVVVDAQTKYQQAQMQTEAEGNAVANCYLIAMGSDAEHRASVQKPLEEYCQAVVNGWNDAQLTYADEREIGPLRSLWTSVLTFEPKTNREQAMYSLELSSITQIGDARRFRVVTRDGGISYVLWAVLVAGGVLTVSFTYFFGVENLRAHVLMTSIVVVALSLNVLLVGLFSNPYHGLLRLRPQPFLNDLILFKRVWAKSSPKP